MSGRWRRVEKMPIMNGRDLLAIQRFYIASLGGSDDIAYYASSHEEAMIVAARLRNTDAQIVTIARVEDAWKRQ